MLFDIRKYYVDLSENTDTYSLGYCEFPSAEEAELAFTNDQVFMGYVVSKVEISTPAQVRQRYKKHTER